MKNRSTVASRKKKTKTSGIQKIQIKFLLLALFGILVFFASKKSEKLFRKNNFFQEINHVFDDAIKSDGLIYENQETKKAIKLNDVANDELEDHYEDSKEKELLDDINYEKNDREYLNNIIKKNN